MNKSSLSTISSIIFLALIAGGFYYIWSSSMSGSGTGAQESGMASAEVVDISGLKEQADKLVADKENNASIPIAVPTAKMGKTNPFTPPE